MSNLAAVIIDIIVFAAFGYTHTLLASFKVKRKAAVPLGKYMAFYRLAYNVIFLIFLWYILNYLPRPDVELYDMPYPWDIIMVALQLPWLIGFLYAFRYFSFHEFTGMAQISRFIEKKYNPSELDEQMTLKIKGPYRIMRHPMYFFLILFLLFRPTMDLFYLIFFLFVVIYSIIGAIYEEKKLVETFGPEYQEYQKAVPMIVPYKLFTPYRTEK